MSVNAMFITSIICRALATISAIGGSIFLAYHGKEGWGWLMFVAICIGCHSLHHDNSDEKEKVEEG
jgi:hypothetical protein